MGPPPRLTFLAFGTRGDVLPVAVVASALAKSSPLSTNITFVTHEAHRNMERPLLQSGVSIFIGVSAAPVVPGRAWEEAERVVREAQLREDCIAAMEGEEGTDGVVINLFALEGWHLAELHRVPCVVLAPYVVPYSAPAAFERRFRVAHPLLYRRLKEAAPEEVGWEEVMHWMWPLFTDRWASWRTHRLHLSACPLTDPVTDLPLLHEWPRASPLLYGFSPQVVECPAYWPRSVSVCGFWFAPLEWEVRDGNSEFKSTPQATSKQPSHRKKAFSHPVDIHSPPHSSSCTSEDLNSTIPTTQDVDTFENQSRSQSDLGDGHDSQELAYHSGCPSFPTLASKSTGDSNLIKMQGNPGATQALNEGIQSLAASQVEQNFHLETAIDESSYQPPAKLGQFMSDHREFPLIFVGLSSMGSMGFIPNPGSLLSVLGAVLSATNTVAILLTAGHPPLDLAASSHCTENRDSVLEGLQCFDGRLFCYSGAVPYAWLLPRCAMAIHHGGSGTTAACLRAGVPQSICPFVLDQFYWAERMHWLGVAPRPLMAHHLMPGDGVEFADAVKVVSAAVREGLCGEVRLCADGLKARIHAEDGTAVAVGILREVFCE